MNNVFAAQLQHVIVVHTIFADLLGGYALAFDPEQPEAITEARGLKIDRKKIKLDDPIREVGTYMVEVELGGGQSAKVKTIVAEAH